MSKVIELAQNVVTELDEFNAELSFSPEFELRDLATMKVVVVPVGTQYKMLSRSTHEELPHIQIGILKRGSQNELPELLKFVENLGLSFLNKRIGDATCFCVTFNPLYSPDHLRERNQITSVIELTFKVLQS
jgi:hypothetical protein